LRFPLNSTLSTGAGRAVGALAALLVVRIHCIIVMIGWTGLAPWEFEFPFPGSLTSTFLAGAGRTVRAALLMRQFKLPWREADPPSHHADIVDSDQ